MSTSISCQLRAHLLLATFFLILSWANFTYNLIVLAMVGTEHSVSAG